MAKNHLVDSVIEVSQDYLGPAAERFVHRQIYSHIGKEPDRLTGQDLALLIDWLKLSFALITDDGELVKDYADQLSAIAKGRS